MIKEMCPKIHANEMHELDDRQNLIHEVCNGIFDPTGRTMLYGVCAMNVFLKTWWLGGNSLILTKTQYY